MRIRSAVLTLVLVGGCGGAAFTARSGDGGEGGGLDGSVEACVPKTCADNDWQCSTGIDPDGCGGMLDCGSCMTAGYLCAPGHQCVCKPLTCTSWGAKCGDVPDGCGGVVQCGTCPQGMSCNGASGQLMCQSGSCNPLTVCPAGDCGSVPDGCGAIVKCTTTCGTGQVCGTDNKCTCAAQNPCDEYGLTCGTALDACGVPHQCGPVPTHEVNNDQDCNVGSDQGSQYYDCCSASVTGDGGASGLDPVMTICPGKLLQGPVPAPEPTWTCTPHPQLNGQTSSTAWCCSKTQ